MANIPTHFVLSPTYEAITLLYPALQFPCQLEVKGVEI